MTGEGEATRQAATRWADTWRRAWREHDADAVAALYADGAEFRSQPFRDAQVGPEGATAYAAWAFADEEPGPDVWFGEPFAVDGDRAAVEYRAVVRDAEGRATTIAGVALLRFGPDGRVVAQRDYWNDTEGDRGAAPAHDA